MARSLKIPDKYSYAHYYAWPAAIRGELIDGEFHDLTPAPSPAHQDVAGSLYVQLMQHFDKHRRLHPFIAPFDVRFPSDPGQEDADIKDVVQPDVCVADRSRIDGLGCRGAPDWIIEVVSGRTERKDQHDKRELYQRYGVAMYWLVSPSSRTVVYLSLSRSGGYKLADAVPATGHFAVARYPGLIVDWDGVFSWVSKQRG